MGEGSQSDEPLCVCVGGDCGKPESGVADMEQRGHQEMVNC